MDRIAQRIGTGGCHWDWYQGTIRGASHQEVSDALYRGFDLADLAPSTPRNGYEHGAEVRRGEHTLATIWWGGNPGIHVKGTGSDSPQVASVVRQWEHRVSRADSRLDLIEEGLFDRYSSILLSYAVANRIKINQQGDWARGKARTFYLGSQQSPVQLCVYEKGYESCGDLNWVRLEVRLRPKGKAGYRVASWLPEDAFQGATWLVEALKLIGWEHLLAQGIGTVWKPSDAERSRRQLCKQYAATLKAWKDEVGGTWEALGEAFNELEARIQSEATDGVLLH